MKVKNALFVTKIRGQSQQPKKAKKKKETLKRENKIKISANIKIF